MPRLRIEGLERDLDVEAGKDVRKACVQGHVNLFWSIWARLFNCRGIGLCGACPVRVLEASDGLPPRTKWEQRFLDGKPEDWRLACQLPVQTDLSIEPFPMVPLEERVGPEAARRAGMREVERLELVRKERRERLEARRREVEESLAGRKKRRSRLAASVKNRFKRDKDPDQEGKGDKGKKEKSQKKEKKGGKTKLWNKTPWGKKEEPGAKEEADDKEEKGEGGKRLGGLAARLKKRKKGEKAHGKERTPDAGPEPGRQPETGGKKKEPDKGFKGRFRKKKKKAEASPGATKGEHG